MKSLAATHLLLALIAPFAQAQESLTTQRMAERIFLFYDARSDIMAQGRIIAMVAPMEARIEFRNRYLTEANKVDYAKLRMKFAQDLQSALKPEEIARLYKFQMEHCMLISDKLARVRAEASTVAGAYGLCLVYGFETLGDFSIEHPDGIPEERLRVVSEFEKPASESDLIDEDAVRMLRDNGITEEDARQIVLHWGTRMAIAHKHALAKHLDEREIRQFLTPQSDPDLAAHIKRSDTLIGDSISAAVQELIKAAGGR